MTAGADPSYLVVVAHPDDETLGAGAWLSRRSRERGYLLHLTDGSPRDPGYAKERGFLTQEAYASARRAELAAALRWVPFPAGHCFRFDFPDQETWLHLPELIEKLRALIGLLHPEVVLSHCYEGGHPDHDSVALAVMAVQGSLGSSGNSTAGSFTHLEFPLYHARADGSMAIRQFPDVFRGGTVEELQLTAGEQTIKRRMLSCFTSQREFLVNFDSAHECFREAPAYDFTRPPHEGELLYERWKWKVTGELWRAHAGKALRTVAEKMTRLSRGRGPSPRDARDNRAGGRDRR